MLGVERRSLVLTEDEAECSLLNEAGHAIVAAQDGRAAIRAQGDDRARRRALGLTGVLPEVDRHNYSKDWLIGSLAMFFGGGWRRRSSSGPTRSPPGRGTTSSGPPRSPAHGRRSSA
jgi:ATP-dependent Zn protease